VLQLLHHSFRRSFGAKKPFFDRRSLPKLMEFVMTRSRYALSFFIRSIAVPVLFSFILFGLIVVLAAAAQAQQSQSSRGARIIVIGEGSVTLAPDSAHLTSGVTTTGKTVKEAIEANSKLMTGVTAALLASGIEQRDIQTSQLSIQPVYVTPEPRMEQKLSGYRVTNQVSVKIRQVNKVGDIVDRVTAAGATDVGNIAFLVSDTSKALDQAREAAIVDARRKAEIYARASGMSVGRTIWITEDSRIAPPPGIEAAAMRQAVPVPIATGENTFQVRITVGYDTAN
jgi:uncharacterized protein YggE